MGSAAGVHGDPLLSEQDRDVIPDGVDHLTILSDEASLERGGDVSPAHVLDPAARDAIVERLQGGLVGEGEGLTGVRAGEDGEEVGVDHCAGGVAGTGWNGGGTGAAVENRAWARTTQPERAGASLEMLRP